MSWQKPKLTDAEMASLKELINLAGNVGCMKPRSILSESQSQAALVLKKKGYVMVSKCDFMVILPP